MNDYTGCYDLDAAANQRVCLLGCGSVGSNALLAALQMGWRKFTLIDFDAVEAHNCQRSAGLFGPNDIGKKKARVLLDYIHAYDKSAEASALDMDMRDIGGAFYEQYDVVVCALDNLESVWHAGECTAGTAIPLYRAATNGYISSVEIVENIPGRACLCCGMDPADARDLRRTSCGTRYLSDVKPKPHASRALQTSSAICANRLVAEMARRMGEPVGTRDVRYYDEGRSLMVLNLTYNPKCNCGGEPVTAEELPGDVFTMTMDGLLSMIEGRRGYGAAVHGADDYVTDGVCVSCGRVYPVGKPLRHVRESALRCPFCPVSDAPGETAIINVYTKNTRGQELDKPLFDLGFRVCGSIISRNNGGGYSAWRLRGDYEALERRMAYV